MICVNLGCGARHASGWLNFDFVSSSKSVVQADLRQGIPLETSFADVVYHSHVLEHFNGQDGIRFLVECYRVLKPGAILRIAVPDLEQITREYLRSIDEVRTNPSPDAMRHHEWMTAEIVDQCTRHQSSGMCGVLIKDWPFEDLNFLEKRWGTEAKRLRALLTQGESHHSKSPHLELIRSIKRKWIRWLTGVDSETIAVGRFRLSGEPHLSMYDEVTLGRVLQSVGFSDVTRMTAETSFIRDWTNFNLDTDPDGSVYKPDSLFMEGIKAA